MNDSSKAHIETYTGKKFYILNPRPEDIDIVDVAHALSQICRFTGHTSRFYSVAEHSYYCSLLVPPEFALEALLHDASEFALGDMNRPLKHFTDAGLYYIAIEKKITGVINKKYGLPAEMSPEVKKADNLMLYAEKKQLMAGGMTWDTKWSETGEATDIFINGWMPQQAKAVFLESFAALCK